MRHRLINLEFRIYTRFFKFINTNEDLSVNNFDDVRIESAYTHELIDIIEGFILNTRRQVFIE